MTPDESSSGDGDDSEGGESTGVVHLVGSGPGDPELLTRKAARLLAEADVVLHDALPGPEIIDAIPEDKREDVGKRAGGERTSQETINDRLVELARAGNQVVRLKGGDPFVFGRGGEEAEHLAAHGIPVEVVPGVSSAVAGPAAAGVPVTHREHASSVSFVTGHEDPDKDESAIDWDALAATGGTIVVLMGVGKLPDYTTALRDAGMESDTPVALIERATRPDQRVATATLDTIVAARDDAGIEPPAVTVIGDVAATRERVIEFFGGIESTREGRVGVTDRVAVFRPDDERLAGAVSLLSELGVEPVGDPMLAVEPTGAAPREDADATILTSTTGVGLAADAEWQPDPSTRVCAIGERTASALREHGHAVDLVPAEFSSSGLIAALEGDVAGARVEVARSDHGSAVLTDGLERAGAYVHETILYHLVRPPGAGRSAELAAAGELAGALFTSSLTVEHFLDAAAERGCRAAAVAGLEGCVVGTIGTPTRATVEEAGIAVDVVPERADFELLARAVVDRLDAATEK